MNNASSSHDKAIYTRLDGLKDDLKRTYYNRTAIIVNPIALQPQLKVQSTPPALINLTK